MLLVMLLQGCQSNKVVKYVVYMPVLNFPVFPVINEITDNKDGTCTVPSEWIIRMQEYHIYITATEKDYKDIKNEILKKQEGEE